MFKFSKVPPLPHWALELKELILKKIHETHFSKPPTPPLLLLAKLNKTVNLMYTWPHVHTLPYIDLSHVVLVTFDMNSHQ